MPLRQVEELVGAAVELYVRVEWLKEISPARQLRVSRDARGDEAHE
jgi:hypothetical protein